MFVGAAQELGLRSGHLWFVRLNASEYGILSPISLYEFTQLLLHIVQQKERLARGKNVELGALAEQVDECLMSENISSTEALKTCLIARCCFLRAP